jgi:geranylgeranyl diphosphate synthase type II
MQSEKLVPAMLAEYGAAARGVLGGYLPKAEPRRYLYDLVADYPGRGGRSFRPTLCIAAARAFGGTLEDVVPTAASIELMHNAMLIHDDIEDESEMRRGKPALHVAEGLALALNAGDALSLLAIRPLVENIRRLGPELAMRVLEETNRMAMESAEGQALELGWRRDNDHEVKEADYLEMVLKKTCWLTTIHPARVGALIGSRGRADVEPFIRFGFLLGAAFQIQDDLLNLEGDAGSYGKELSGDIYEGKRTLMLIHLFEEGTALERERLHGIFSRPRAARTIEEVRWVRALMDRYDAVDYARQVAQGLAGAAQHECARILGALPASRDRDFIEALPVWVIERD